jgi:hypothetical protein
VAARNEVQSDARSVDAKTDFAWEPPPSVLQRRTEPHGSARLRFGNAQRPRNAEIDRVRPGGRALAEYSS